MAGRMKIPPCGAGALMPKYPTIAPAIADPITHEGSTVCGSAAANGIAPSVMKDAPRI